MALEEMPPETVYTALTFPSSGGLERPSLIVVYRDPSDDYPYVVAELAARDREMSLPDPITLALWLGAWSILPNTIWLCAGTVDEPDLDQVSTDEQIAQYKERVNAAARYRASRPSGLGPLGPRYA